MERRRQVVQVVDELLARVAGLGLPLSELVTEIEDRLRRSE